MIKSDRRQNGFVLAATLWILAIITIGASFFAERVAKSIETASKSQDITQALIDMSSTRAEVLFRFCTTPLSIYGIGVTKESAIALDNRPYSGSATDVLFLQDSRGLINVTNIRPEMLQRLLGQMGVAADKRDALLDTLNDYTDTDDNRRLNGAEAAEYRARGLPLPPNDWLLTPWQLQNIIGWGEQTVLWQNQRLPEIVTAAHAIGFNPNTAPREALAAMPGSSPEIADRIIQRRAIRPFVDLRELIGVVGPVGLDQDSMLFFPADNIRLTQTSDKIPWSLRFQISLTPQAENAPWRIDYYIKTGPTSSAQNANKPVPLPAYVALPTSPDPTF